MSMQCRSRSTKISSVVALRGISARRRLSEIRVQQLQDLYLNDNNLDGNIPERMVVNCERLQRLYLGGNRLTGTVPRYLRHVKDLRELNIERNNLHGEVRVGYLSGVISGRLFVVVLCSHLHRACRKSGWEGARK